MTDKKTNDEFGVTYKPDKPRKKRNNNYTAPKMRAKKRMAKASRRNNRNK